MEDLPIEIDITQVPEFTACANVVLLDCRERSETDIVKLGGATWIPMDQIPSRIEELAPFRDRRIIVYCHHGMRSLMVARWLREQGFTMSQSMTGGIDAWAQQVDPSIRRY